MRASLGPTVRLRADHARHHRRSGWGAAAAATAFGLATGAVFAERADVDPDLDGGDVTKALAAHETTEAVVAAVTAPMALDALLPVVDLDEAVEEDGDSAADLSLAQWSIDEPISPWVVVNKLRPLDPIDYAPSGLVHIDGVPGGSSERLRSEAAEALAELRDAAVGDGLDFSITSGYRSYAEQRTLHATYAGRRGATTAENFSARAGYSEHQTGWAADIYGSEECRVERCFADEEVGLWVAAHAWEYGWIIRYPEGEFETTGYWFEPWHLRYVGVELSTWMYEQEIDTLEEAMDLDAAPDYLD